MNNVFSFIYLHIFISSLFLSVALKADLVGDAEPNLLSTTHINNCDNILHCT